AVPINEFRHECREFAAHWINVQREEFQRLGIVGDWAHPYSTMNYVAESTIAGELMKFAMNGTLYRGSKPVMWSVVEKTALAEAEVEYVDYTSDQVWVKFPIIGRLVNGQVLPVGDRLRNTSIAIWTTTPWTIPGNRAIAYSSKIEYAQYEVIKAPDDNWLKPGDRLITAVAYEGRPNSLVEQMMKAARVEEYKIVEGLVGGFSGLVCAHPLRALGYDFDVPLLEGAHVTEDTGTGFVHTAPGHGADDYHIWTANQVALDKRGIVTTIPFTVDASGVFTEDAPGFTGKRVLTEKGTKGDANDAVIKALVEANALIAHERLKHQYPHSWRSKKPVIFRNTPQWFIAVDKLLGRNKKSANLTLREAALKAIGETEWVPRAGENRIRGMIEQRPDWVLSRQRAWGVPITVFTHKETGEVIPSAKFKKSKELIARITKAFAKDGSDVWFTAGARERFLDGLVDDPADWEQVHDTLDVWFDSGSTHAFTLEDPKRFPGLAGIERMRDGGKDSVMYLEGSDQHRGWFQSSLLESCGTRARAPYDIVLTHGFILDEKGEDKMSKSKGNVRSTQEVIKASGADILRLWVASADYAHDIRFGPGIVKHSVEAYRKLRNTLRWMLGALAHLEPNEKVKFKDMHELELERLMLHLLCELNDEVREAYASYDYRKVVALLSQFMNSELSAFYFDIRKDALYCEPYSSVKRRAALTVIDVLLEALVAWLAPILSFTAEEVWLARHDAAEGSVHLETFPEIDKGWRNDELAQKWEKVRAVRRVVTGALELERAGKRIGSSLEAAPDIYVADNDMLRALERVDLAEISITSAAKLIAKAPPKDAFTLPDVPGVGVVPKRAEGKKCARSWRILADVGADLDFPELSPRDAAAVREFDQRAKDAPA
ncbi:MAG: isoleucine--tRNA ligase, partial [Hyphomicrobium sp.]